MDPTSHTSLGIIWCGVEGEGEDVREGEGSKGGRAREGCKRSETGTMGEMGNK